MKQNNFEHLFEKTLNETIDEMYSEKSVDEHASSSEIGLDVEIDMRDESDSSGEVGLDVEIDMSDIEILSETKLKTKEGKSDEEIRNLIINDFEKYCEIMNKLLTSANLKWFFGVLNKFV